MVLNEEGTYSRKQKTSIPQSRLWSYIPEGLSLEEALGGLLQIQEPEHKKARRKKASPTNEG